jgi:hypothetical protein
VLVRRCLVSAGSGALAALAMTLVPAQDWCTGAACLLVGVVAVPLLLMGAALLAWLLMGLARVRESWQVAIGGPLAVLALVTTVLDMTTSIAWYLGVIAACYALAAAVTAEQVPRAWRVALASPVVVLFGWGVVLPIVSAWL